MTKEQYERWTAPIARHPKGALRLKQLNTILTGACYLCYPLLLLWLIWNRDGRFWRAALRLPRHDFGPGRPLLVEQ